MSEQHGQEPDRRGRILEAGLRVFSERGFHRATIKEIAREAEIRSPALIYWYFEDKDDLFRAVLRETSPLARIAADAASLMERSPEEVLPVLARAHLDSFDDPAVVRLFKISLSESALNPGTSSGFVEGLQEMVLGFFVAYLQRQVELGALRPHDPQTSARVFFGPLVVYILGREVFLPLKKGTPDKEQYVRDVVEVFLNGLRA